MLHPFINNLSEKSLEDLQTTIASLTSKLTFAYRSGNGPLIHQLNMALESYKDAYTKKMDDLVKKQNIQTKVSIKKENEA